MTSYEAEAVDENHCYLNLNKTENGMNQLDKIKSKNKKCVGAANKNVWRFLSILLLLLKVSQRILYIWK